MGKYKLATDATSQQSGWLIALDSKINQDCWAGFKNTAFGYSLLVHSFALLFITDYMPPSSG